MEYCHQYEIEIHEGNIMFLRSGRNIIVLDFIKYFLKRKTGESPYWFYNCAHLYEDIEKEILLDFCNSFKLDCACVQEAHEEYKNFFVNKSICKLCSGILHLVFPTIQVNPSIVYKVGDILIDYRGLYN